jgi:hypothetical protein
LGFVACSGSSEHVAPRKDSPAGGGEASAGQGNAGPRPQGGDSSTATPVGDGGSGILLGDGGSGATEAGRGGDSSSPGSGGQTALGGQAAGGERSTSAGGQAMGGEASNVGGGAGGGGAGGETSAPPIDPICGPNMAQVGAYSLWCGKVNMHKNAQGDWTHDADCSSGCNIKGVGYCQKFYPNTTTVVAVDQTASVVKDWKNAGCDDSYPDGKGISGEAVCCAPL